MSASDKTLTSQGAGPDEVRAFLEHLTGPNRGHVAWLAADTAFASVGDERDLKMNAAAQDDSLARLTWTGDTYEIAILGEGEVWVNGRKTGTAHLQHGDMIEFGAHGPMSRFRLCRQSFPTRWSVDDILSDSYAYFRSSRRGFGPRLSGAFLDGTRRLVVETTLLFRATVVLALIGLAVFSFVQFRTDQQLKADLRQESMRLEGIAAALTQAQRDALTPAELKALRDEFTLRLDTNAERLAALERRSQETAQVIRESVRSVAFLQGAYGLRHDESGQMLSHIVDEAGKKRMNAFGQPMISPEGTGPPVEFQFTGTGFRIADGSYLVTNRHVAQPWTAGDMLSGFRAAGMTPEMLKLVAYLPGGAGPLPAALDRASDDADLALLLLTGPETGDVGLTLAETSPSAGDEVIVMGYPTGLKALLAQAGPDFLALLDDAGDTDFWSVAQRLSEESLIMPLASRGIVGQVATQVIIYDAETTHGGSGGPVLDRNGHVVAVNTAILPEFGGSNIGISVAALRDLLAGAASQ